MCAAAGFSLSFANRHRTCGITTVLYEYILVCARGFPDFCLHINFIAGLGSLSEKYLQWY